MGNLNLLDITQGKEEAESKFTKLVNLRENTTQYDTVSQRKELAEVLNGTETATLLKLQILDKQKLIAAIRQDLRLLSLEIQGLNQDVAVLNNQIIRTPHLTEELSRKFLDTMSYPERLQFVLSQENNYAKVHPKYLDKQIEKAKKTRDRLNPRLKDKTVERKTKKKLDTEFIQKHLVIDPAKITDDIITYILQGKDWEDANQITDTSLKSVKDYLSNPVHLKYKNPKKPSENTATSRISFFKDTGTIGVFRGNKTHTIVPNPTQSEKRKERIDMKLSLTNSSYDALTWQYDAVQKIMKKRVEIRTLADDLKKILSDMLIEKKGLDEEQKTKINDIIEIITPEVNPKILMARLYNLENIPHHKNRIVQENLLEAAIRKFDKRAEMLVKYLHAMVPQLHALQGMHDSNKMQMDQFIQDLLVGADKNNFAMASSQWRKMDSYHKSDIDRFFKKVVFEDRDSYLIGMFYTMHHELGTLLRMPKSEGNTTLIKIRCCQYKLILAAEQLKQDIELGKVSKPNIDVVPYFGDARGSVFDAFPMESPERNTHFKDLYANYKKIPNVANIGKYSECQKLLNTFQSTLPKTVTSKK